MGLCWVAGGYGAQQGYSDERNSARRVADHYGARSNQTLEERKNSAIIHLKKLNNWVCPRLAAQYSTRPVWKSVMTGLGVPP
jgi:mRNA (guanine-N7-)-methyltransferase